MTKGTIYKIEKFAPHDGHGIRTVVFLKGCPLHCQWCSSPESQNIYPEMAYLKKSCTFCERCINVCPNGAITLNDMQLFTDRKKCTNCGKCTEACLNMARKIVGYEVTVDEIVKEIMKDAVFYHNSGGGVTLSGGEVTVQSGFAAEVLKECCMLGVNTAIETCAYCKWENLEKIVEYTHRVYVDVKCVDSEKHKKLTGSDNFLILDNIRKLSEITGIELIPRAVIIPGYNDTDEDINNLCQFISGLKNIYRLELLPYHKYGIHMYDAVDKKYDLGELEVPSDDYIKKIKSMLENNGFDIQIGG